MKYASLFAGIGGFDLALNRGGHKCVYVNEWDRYATQTYEKNFNPEASGLETGESTNENIRQNITNNKSRNGRHDAKGMRIRRLTPIECERLQGFPDNWTIGVSDTQRYKQLGNAVTVNVVEAIIKRL